MSAGADYMSHLASPMHCWLDRLGRTVLALTITVGGLYISAYAFGWPNLPDPDKQWRKSHHMQPPSHDCRREETS